ncbi:MAG: DUF2723 domain-containing protein [Bacteroidetes bacterium]|nr:DUF2723 domain-containing protein [Bacteroidota bacterium]
MLSKKAIYSLLSFFIPFIVYLMTLAPDVTFIDSGELAAVAAGLGVAHPTGYPLFTVLGKLFTLMPFGSQVYMLNVMSAVMSSAALFMFFNLMMLILPGMKLGTDDIISDKKKIPEISLMNISLAATLVLAFSRTFWDTANAVEVYSLHTFFLVTNIFLILKSCSFQFGSAEDKKTGEKYWLLFSFVLGLSFTNHLSTVFLSVGCIYIYFAVLGFNKSSFKRILILALPFIIGYSFYTYLIIRADNPVISWGYPHNFENFWRHFTGKQFSIWMFSSFENAGKQFSHFTENYPVEFFYLPVLIAIPGLFYIFRHSRRLFYFTVLLFGFCILYAINYDIYDIDSYFLLAFIVTCVWFGFGLLFILNRISGNLKQISFALILTAVIPLSMNYKSVDESRNYFVKDYMTNIFNSADPNSIIISTQWDFWISSSLYYQLIKNERPDIIVIDKELLRKSWYMHYLETHYPEFYGRSRAEFDNYLAELVKFEKNPDRYTQPKTEADRQDLQKIQSSFLKLLESFVDNNINDHNFYTTFEIEKENSERFGAGYNKVPQGLLIKYTKDKNYLDLREPDMKFTVTERPEYHYSFLMNAYFSSYLNKANYYMNHSEFDKAEALIQKALEIKPQHRDAVQLLTKLKQLRELQNNSKQ